MVSYMLLLAFRTEALSWLRRSSSPTTLIRLGSLRAILFGNNHIENDSYMTLTTSLKSYVKSVVAFTTGSQMQNQWSLPSDIQRTSSRQSHWKKDKVEYVVFRIQYYLGHYREPRSHTMLDRVEYCLNITKWICNLPMIVTEIVTKLINSIEVKK